MKKVRLLFLLFFPLISWAQHSVAIIPQPEKMTIYEGSFTISEKTIITSNGTLPEVDYLQNYIKEKHGIDLSFSDKKPKTNYISLEITPMPTMPKEAYELEVNSSGVSIKASDNHGIFYGIQSLIQLLPLERKNLKVTHLSISDAPKYKWRGMHLDVCRHFFDKEQVKQYIDYLSQYKFNTFHWHLTDDQGWRIEIKKYPKLTEVGAYRNGTMVGKYVDQKYDDIRYGGYFTQEDIKEVVAYAGQRHITIVPEIEMPGHAVAALASYPELSCTGGPFEVERGWGVFDDVFCSKEETFEFLENVLDEVIALFPSEYIHIGGDESPKTRWQACEHCQSVIRRENLKDEHELQSYFITRMEKYVNSKGRKIIGWDEILEGGLAPNAAVMSWRGTEGGIAAAKQRHYVVMAPGSHCYFDHYQLKPQEDEPLAFPNSYTPLSKVYSFNPTPESLNEEERQYILGAQANLWTEYITSFSQLQYMLFPRALALSEVLWGTANIEKYKEFEERVIGHTKKFDRDRINYAKVRQ